MTRASGIYIASPEGDTGKSTIALGLLHHLAGTVARSRAAELGADLSAATVLNPQTSELCEKFAEQIAQLR